MKYLKIDNNKGYYSLDGADWTEIDKVDKQALLSLLSIAIALDSDFEMDNYEDANLDNQAHQIIYRNIYGKFLDIISNKQQFQDESRNMYKEALEKYKINNSN